MTMLTFGWSRSSEAQTAKHRKTTKADKAATSKEAEDARAAEAANTANTATAANLKQQADARFDAKKFQEALALYDQSYALVPQISIFYDRGRVYQYLGQYPRAEEQLTKFGIDAPADLKAKVAGFDAILADVHSHVATVHVSCSVPSARVLIGSMDMGATPLPDLHVNAGEQRVEVLADGYYPFHRTINLPGGQSTPVDVTLASRDRHGLLVVKSGLIGTAVSIDGHAIGIAPTESALDSGAHGVNVSHEGYADANTRIFLQAGERKELELSPLTKPSIFSRWWFWTITGAVVVSGAAVVTYFAV
ncbi:MAG: PEGA domain-containing protein, partial [Polyangiaceae bacterium]